MFNVSKDRSKFHRAAKATSGTKGKSQYVDQTADEMNVAYFKPKALKVILPRVKEVQQKSLDEAKQGKSERVLGYC